MSITPVLAYSVTLLHCCIWIVLSLRIISRKMAPSAALAWLLLIGVFPFFGAALYALIGERPLGRRHLQRIALLRPAFHRWLNNMPADALGDPTKLSLSQTNLTKLAKATSAMPLIRMNDMTLIENAQSILNAIIADLDAAVHSCDMAFYIWNEGGLADSVGLAIERAAKRGLRCRLLLDGVGSALFWRGGWPARLRAAGVIMEIALPVNPLRALFVRADLRMHRKIVIIDDRIAYTGSANLVDPKYFKQDEGVGEWVDAMLRIDGPPVEALRGIFQIGWATETGEAPVASDARHRHALPPPSDVSQSCIITPSGPDLTDDDMRKLVLCALYDAQREIVITTPYFVPDEAILVALESAAMRGVAVTLIVPQRVDSRLVQYASHSFFDSLLVAGVKIVEFENGLLHTKSLTTDGSTAFFGTFNLDIRSMRLNFEVTAILFNPDITQKIRALQAQYERQSRTILLDKWRQRSIGQKLLENLARLTSPLL